MSTYYLIHTSTANRKTRLNFNSEAQAKLWAYRMRRSPKTKAVAITAEGVNPMPHHLQLCPRPYKVRTWITDKCRIVWRVES